MNCRILQGDCRDVLKTLPEESVHCIVTSPPYWRQRDYQIKGQIGLEMTPEEYCAEMVATFREARRVLHSSGTLWLNLGDKWASGGNGGGSFMEQRGEAWTHAKNAKGWRNPPNGYKDKDLVGIPWMVAFALRADGWFLRQCNVWAKPNCMPESVRDRSTISHEYVFQLSKKNDYYYNTDAARTPALPSTETGLAQDVQSQHGSLRANGGNKTNGTMKAVTRKNLPGSQKKLGEYPDKQRGHFRKHDGFNGRWDAMEKAEQQMNGANLRSVWWVSPAQYGDEHYAVMPERIAEICIAAGCPEGGTVLDPFSGAGTTGVVARRFQRNYIGIELNAEYVAMSEKRITEDAPLFNTVTTSASAD